MESLEDVGQLYAIIGQLGSIDITSGRGYVTVCHIPVFLGQVWDSPNEVLPYGNTV